MDTSETYIKMRLAAVPNLGRGVFPTDTTYTFDQVTLVMVDSQGNFFVFRDEDGRFCQLERQDQLQEMMHEEDVSSYPVSHLLKRLDEFYSSDWYGEDDAGSITWEQLWLAFMMKENHNKVWDGNAWA